ARASQERIEPSFQEGAVRQGCRHCRQGPADRQRTDRSRARREGGAAMSAMSGSPVVDEPASSARSEAPEPNDSVLSASRPFPGLRPFAFADRAFFFGRESHVFALYRLVENGRFIAVIGSSGSGKSSLVLAGLCGLLDEETQDQSGPRW